MWNQIAATGWLLIFTYIATVQANTYYTQDHDLLSRLRGYGRRLFYRDGMQQGFQCQNEGFYADPNDCKKFYRCVNYGGSYGLTAFEFQCGDGTVFDEAIIACNHPWAVNGPCGMGNSETGDSMQSGPPSSTATGGGPLPPSNQEPAPEPVPEPVPEPEPPTDEASENNEIEDSGTGMGGERPTCTSEGFFANPNDCTKFYRCVAVNDEGQYDVYVFDCGPGTVYDEVNMVCSHPRDVIGPCGKKEEANVAESGSENTGSNESANNSNSENTENNSNGSNGSNNNGSSESIENTNESTENNESSSSNQGATATSESSPPQNVVSTTQQSTSTSAASGGEFNCEMCSHCDKEPKPSRGECKEEGFYPVKNDCRKFYRCVSNNKPGSFSRYDFECGEGTVYDIDNNVCNHANVVQRDCSETPESPPQPGDNQNNEQNATDTSNQSGVEQPPATQIPEGSDNSSEPVSSSPGGSQTASTESPTDSNPTPSEGTAGTENPNNGQASSESPSNQSESSETNGPPTNEATDAPPNSVNTPSEEKNPDNTSDQEVTDPPPPSDGTSTGTESPGSSEQGTGEPKPTPDCNKEGFYPNPDDCKKFYRCVDNGKGGYTKYDFDCAEGTVFDPSIEVCNHERDVPGACSKNNNSSTDPNDPAPQMTTEGATTMSGGTSEETTVSGFDTTTQSTEMATTESQTTSKPLNETSPPPSPPCRPVDPNPQIVNCTKNGYYPDPTICENFYVCMEWANKTEFTVYFLQCPEGNIYDPDKNICNLPEYVNPPRNCDQTTTESSTTTVITTVTTETVTTVTEGTSIATTETTTDDPATTITQTETSVITTTTEGQTTNPDDPTNSPTTVEVTTEVSTESSTEGTTGAPTDSPSGAPSETTTETTMSPEFTTIPMTETPTDTPETTTSTSSPESSTEVTTNNPVPSKCDEACCNKQTSERVYICPTEGMKPHPKHCNVFYQCEESDDGDANVIPFMCPNGTYYGRKEQKCIKTSEGAGCDNREMKGAGAATRRTKYSKELLTAPKAELCPNVGFYSYEQDCRHYFHCRENDVGEVYGSIKRCPDGFTFWEVSRRCELASRIARKCSRRSESIMAWDIPVDFKNIGRLSRQLLHML